MKLINCTSRSILLALLTFGFAFYTQANKPKKQPNILFILADDLGWTDLSCTGSSFYETPNIDGIAAKGMVFSQGYAACQVCSPSRASIMTGMYTTKHGVTEWIGQKSGADWRKAKRYTQLLSADYSHQLKKEFVTLPEALKETGYQTFFAGKWHLGGEGSYPEDHGFDVNIGGYHAGGPKGGYFSPYKNPKMTDGPKGENLSMRLAKETVQFMTSNQEKPFFAYLSFYAVHAGIQTSQDKWSKYQQKATAKGIEEFGYKMERRMPIRQVQDNPVYAGLIENMDDAVGYVINNLKKLGLDKNTIVVFTSDNGGVASGDNFSTSNLPLRGGKGYQWEGGIREPYFINVPWIKNAGETCQVPVSGIDFYPTLLDLAGVSLKPNNTIDGVSLVPLLNKHKIAERPLFWHYPHYSNQGGDPSSIIRLGDWKLIYYHEDGHNELYNIKNDLSESIDVSTQNAETTQKLSTLLQEWLKETGAIMPQVDDEYNAKLEKQRQEKITLKLWPEQETKRLQILKQDWQPNADWWGSMLTTD